MLAIPGWHGSITGKIRRPLDHAGLEADRLGLRDEDTRPLCSFLGVFLGVRAIRARAGGFVVRMGFRSGREMRQSPCGRLLAEALLEAGWLSGYSPCRTRRPGRRRVGAIHG